VSYTKLNVSDPFTVGVDAIGVGWLRPLVKIGVIGLELGHPGGDII
jgi:APA family basic amino acid/polyamine antiporter